MSFCPDRRTPKRILATWRSKIPRSHSRAPRNGWEVLKELKLPTRGWIMPRSHFSVPRKQWGHSQEPEVLPGKWLLVPGSVRSIPRNTKRPTKWGFDPYYNFQWSTCIIHSLALLYSSSLSIAALGDLSNPPNLCLCITVQ